MWYEQGPSQPGSPSRQSSSANGPFSSPGNSNPFATPASVTSHHSLEDEETLLLDPQVLLLTSHMASLACGGPTPRQMLMTFGGHIVSLHGLYVVEILYYQTTL